MKVIKETTPCTKMYKCPVCDELCDTKALAKSHCIDETESVWVCDECEEEFDNSQLARQCCPLFICGTCDESYDNRVDAAMCCCDE